MMPEQNSSAFAAIRTLRDQLRARLDQNEDYRAWKALDEALRALEPATMPKAVELAIGTISRASEPAAPQTPDEDVFLTFDRRMKA